MITVNIVLPDGKPKRGRISSSSASLEKVKADICSAFTLGDPNDYDMAIRPSNWQIPLANYRLSDGDTIVITKRGGFDGTVFEEVPVDQ